MAGTLALRNTSRFRHLGVSANSGKTKDYLRPRVPLSSIVLRWQTCRDH